VKHSYKHHEPSAGTTYCTRVCQVYVGKQLDKDANGSL